MDHEVDAEPPAEPQADEAEVSAAQRRRRLRIVLTVQAIIVGAAVISTVLALTLRSSGPSVRTAADPAGTTTSQPSVAGPPAAEPSPVLPSTVDSTPSRPGTPATTNPPLRFGSILVTDQVLHAEPASPVRYQIAVHYPAVSGLADSARQNQINTRLRAPADQALAGFTSDFGGYPAGSGDNGFATVDNETSVVGKLISVRFDTVFRFPGAGSINRDTKGITIRLDTAAPIDVSAMFTPDGLSDHGQRAISFGLARKPEFVACEVGEGKIRAAFAGTLSGQGAGAVTVTSEGLKFSFTGATVEANSCDLVFGVLSLPSLTRIVDPGLVALATST
jgi:hypothetical protein